MYSRNNTTKPISARLAPGLTERIDFECAQSGKWNRNKFLNMAAELLLTLRYESRCGNLDPGELPPALRRYSNLFT